MTPMYVYIFGQFSRQASDPSPSGATGFQKGVTVHDVKYMYVLYVYYMAKCRGSMISSPELNVQCAHRPPKVKESLLLRTPLLLSR